MLNEIHNLAKIKFSGGFERESAAKPRDEGCFAALNPGFPSNYENTCSISIINWFTSITLAALVESYK
jgi:hypothetical protein